MDSSPSAIFGLIQGLPIFNLTYWGIQTAAMILTALLIPNLRITSIFGPILAVAGLSVVNMTVWSSELFSTLPSVISAQTVTLLAMNGAIFWLLVKLLPGIESKGILPVIIAPLVFTACSATLPQIIQRVDWPRVAEGASALLGETKKFIQQSPQSSPPKP